MYLGAKTNSGGVPVFTTVPIPNYARYLLLHTKHLSTLTVSAATSSHGDGSFKGGFGETEGTGDKKYL